MGLLDPPQNTGVPSSVDRWFQRIANAVNTIFERVRALDEAQVVTVAGDFAMTSENVVEYTGSGGNTITLPPAAAISGRRTRIRVIINDSPITGGATPIVETAASTKTIPGALVVAATASDTLNGGTFLAMPAGTMAVFVSNGASSWRAHSPMLTGTVPPSFTTISTIDPAAGSTIGKFGWRIATVFKALADVAGGRNCRAYQFEYEINANGKAMSSIWNGFRLAATETDLGGGTHTPMVIQVGSTTVFSVDRTGGITSNASAINFNHARMATPATLADVIAVLQAFGLVS